MNLVGQVVSTTLTGFTITSSMLFTGLGALLLLILPIAVLIRIIVLLVFVWVENRGERAWEIIKKSFELTRGSVGWVILLSIFLFAIITTIAALIVTIVPILGPLLNIVLQNLYYSAGIPLLTICAV